MKALLAYLRTCTSNTGLTVTHAPDEDHGWTGDVLVFRQERKADYRKKVTTQIKEFKSKRVRKTER